VSVVLARTLLSFRIGVMNLASRVSCLATKFSFLDQYHFADTIQIDRELHLISILF
jgi:hypothetical protein